jgi:hypothetical protein
MSATSMGSFIATTMCRAWSYSVKSREAIYHTGMRASPSKDNCWKSVSPTSCYLISRLSFHLRRSRCKAPIAV